MVKKKKVMYYILVYDIASAKRLPKALKICRKYLHWIQRSVFEGELTKAQYIDLKNDLKRIMEKKEDSIILFAIRNTSVIDKEVIGKEISEISYFF